jgi:hypothetical protein
VRRSAELEFRDELLALSRAPVHGLGGGAGWVVSGLPAQWDNTCRSVRVRANATRTEFFFGTAVVDYRLIGNQKPHEG